MTEPPSSATKSEPGVQSGEISPGTRHPEDPSMKLARVGILILTGWAYSLAHSLRTSWAYLKGYIDTDDSYANIFGSIDMLFLFGYAFGMYFSGWLGGKMKQNKMLSMGIVGTAVFSLLLSFEGYYGNFGQVLLWVLLSFLNGFLQANVYPTAIGIIGNWYGRKGKGILMGCWASSANLGNVFGQLVAGITIAMGASWIWPVVIIFILCLIHAASCYFVLKPLPPLESAPADAPNPNVDVTSPIGLEDIEIPEAPQPDAKAEARVELPNANRNSTTPLSGPEVQSSTGPQKITFWTAWKLPGVALFAVTFASLKSAQAGLLFWLPNYLHAEAHLGEEAVVILICYEFGQMIGGMVVGFFSDRLHRRTVIITTFLYVAFLLFLVLGSLPFAANGMLYIVFFFAGVSIGGPYNIILSAVINDLSLDHRIADKKKALSLISGIIEGTGSMAAALVQLIIPSIRKQIFYMFMGCFLISGIILTPRAVKEKEIPTASPLKRKKSAF